MEGSVIDELIFSVSFVGIGIYLVWVLILILFGQDQKLQQTQLKEPIEQLIILVPALNEALVIRQTITNFVAQTASLPQVKMVIIDDASSDQTAQVVNETLQQLACGSKVQLLQRYLPEAQQGKGEALNWAYQQLVEPLAPSLRKRVICGVLDADAYMDEVAYLRVMEHFAFDPELSLLQTRVAMFKEQNWLQKLQDIEFVIINNWIQNIRNRLGNAAASGNGQFIRVSAVNGYYPWGNALLEDFEFSTRFLLQAKATHYASEIVVYQEALAQVRPFIRQRARWTQGGLDCLVGYWPKILLSKAIGTKAKMEMTFYLLLPFISLATGLANLLVLVFVSWFIQLYWPIVVSLLFINSCFNFYILSIYEHETRRLGIIKKLFFMTIMLGYNYLFYFAIVLACYKKIRRQTKRVKTTHVGVGEKA